MARAFTLVELLAVVAIVALLAAIAVSSFSGALTRSKVAKSKAALNALRKGVEAYHADNRQYPFDEDAFGPNRVTTPVAYLTSLPQDPFPTERELLPEAEGLYWYHRLVDRFAPGDGPTIRTSDVPRKEELDRIWGVWFLTGGGPSLEDNKAGVWTSYDPTNGTRSAGWISMTQRGVPARP